MDPLRRPTWRDLNRDTLPWADALQSAWRRDALPSRKLAAVAQLNAALHVLSHANVSSIAVTMLPSPIQVTLQVAQALDALGVPYLVGGSLASAVYGLQRATLDADLVADLRLGHIRPLVERLAADFYVDQPSMVEAVATHSHFNLIHQATMFKVAIFVAKPRPFDQAELSRRVRLVLADDPQQSAYVASAEDTILAKLEWYRLGGEVSERQWRDVLSMLRDQQERLDFGYMHYWAAELEVSDLLEEVIIAADT